MDATFLRKTFALIAKGLVEKEQLLQKEPTRYPYSKALQHGINMFLVASHQIGAVQDIDCMRSKSTADNDGLFSFFRHFTRVFWKKEGLWGDYSTNSGKSHHSTVEMTG